MMTDHERVKAWRAANPGRRAEYARNRYQNDPAYREDYLAKQRANYAANLEENRRKNREKRARQRAERPDPPECPDKLRDRHLKKRYGFTTVEKVALLTKQGGVCAICRTDKPTGRNGWHVDHCHTTGKVRGVLCSKCNMAIGLLKDDPNVVNAAELYLRNHHATHSPSTEA